MKKQRQRARRKVTPLVGEESPLRVNVIRGELVVRVGINRLDGHDQHESIPALKFDDRTVWALDVAKELCSEEEDGSTPLSDLLDKCINAAIENGSTGLAEDTPTHVGECETCGNDQQPLTHTKNGQCCPACIANKGMRRGDE